MQLKYLLTLLSVLCFFAVTQAQREAAGRLKYKTLVLSRCEAEPDSLSLIPSSVEVRDAAGVRIKHFTISNRRVLFADSICAKYAGQEIFIQYRTFDFDASRIHFVLDSAMLTYQDIAIGGYELRQITKSPGIIDAPGLNYRGSFARGLSVGNSQSLVLNSNFDLQLYGDLGGGLKVAAAISDENLPIQAQGNTQQLQEFDKVFIQVSKDRTTVTAGDYELRRPDSYFSNYFKKLKGLSVLNKSDFNDKVSLTTAGSFAISRGKFARQILDIREGNQGPYRLQGNNGERFIIVLAGTEKVFFNGILLTRGFDYDYIMDYNRAEISFSPTRVIARDSRVIVEFEYTDITYLRSLYSTNATFEGPKWKANFNFYSEQDSKNATGDIQLDSTDIAILSQSGDDKSKAVRSGIRSVTPSERVELNRILYKGIKNASVPEGVILVFTESIDSAEYIAFFTEVGTGLGNYEIDNTQLRNSRVYRYVGEGMGRYRPIIQLIPPEKKQLITINATFSPTASTELFGELALSNLDLNTRSAINNEDNTGIAAFTGIKHSFRLDTAARWQLTTQLKHEYVSENFNALNPYRPPEFIRDWNVTALTQRAEENILSTSASLTSGKSFSLDYGFNLYDRAGLYSGKKHQITWITRTERWQIRAYSSFLNSVSNTLGKTTDFIRPNINARYLLNKKYGFYAGIEWDAESNLLRSTGAGNLLNNSYQYSHIKGYAETDFQKDLAFRLAYSVRTDYFADADTLTKASEAAELELSGKWHQGRASELSWAVTGRNLRSFRPELILGETNRRSLLGRLDYGLQLWNGALRSNTLFNVNSGQEPKIEYIFQRVERGQGEYFLINPTESPNLSNIQDFRYDPSNPLSEYIRLTLFNNEFIRTQNSEINQNIRIEAARFFKEQKQNQKKSAWQKWVSRISGLSNIRMSKRRMDNATGGFGGFFNFDFRDTALVAYNALLNNSLFFNRGNVLYDIQLTNQQTRNRTARVNGYEDRENQEYLLRARLKVKRKADVFITAASGTTRYEVEIFPERNLDIRYYTINPEVSYRPSQTTRIILKYIHTDKYQQILTKDNASIRDVTIETSWRKASGFSLDQSFSWVNIRFTGLPNSPIEYDMLEGLKNGTNFLWTFTYTKRLAGNIDMTLNYEGRKTGILQPVHVGRMQVRATF